MAKVADFMSSTIYTIGPDKYAFEAVDQMCQNKISSLFVKGDQGFLGIITKTDWMLLVLRGECDPKEIKVSSVMTGIAHTIDKNETIAKACSMIEENNVRHLPVTENNEIVGMFSVKDLERYYLQLHKKTDY